MRRWGAALCAGLLVAGCAGRDPVPVSAYQPNDTGLSCNELNTEIQGNNDALRTRVQESKDKQDRNILIGGAALLLFWPAAFAMDMKGAADTEAKAYEQRNRTLALLAAKKKCSTTHPMTVAEAEAERVAKAAAAEKDNDLTGVRTPTDQRLEANRMAAAPVAEPAMGSGGVDNARLHELMDRFLRGEITKDEYERLRAG